MSRIVHHLIGCSHRLRIHNIIVSKSLWKFHHNQRSLVSSSTAFQSQAQPNKYERLACPTTTVSERPLNEKNRTWNCFLFDTRFILINNMTTFQGIPTRRTLRSRRSMASRFSSFYPAKFSSFSRLNSLKNQYWHSSDDQHDWSRGARVFLLSLLFALIPAAASVTHVSDKTYLSDDDEGISSLEEDNDDDDITSIVKSAATQQKSSLSSHYSGMKWLNLKYTRRTSTSSDSSCSSCHDDSECLQARYQQSLFNNVEVALIKLLPLKFISRVWGWINSLPLPTFLRVFIISWYCRTFHCNVSEAEIEDLSHYRCLGDFFKRSLKPGCRCIDETAAVVSPSDGTVVHFGEVNEETVEQVKGVKYSLPAFLGPKSWPSLSPSSSSSSLESMTTSSSSLDSLEEEEEKRYHQKLVFDRSKENTLYHCVIYLAPGDYHRFHSPAEWDIHYRRHFSGKLLSIRPSFMSWIEDLFTLNERVTYFGSWIHGFFSMTAVGATNVGSVRVYFDDQLKTNSFLSRHGSFKDRSLTEKPVHRVKGDPFGEFNLGSTLVLIFEAPKGLKCSVAAGDTVKYGQRLFCFDDNHNPDNNQQRQL